MNILWEFKKLTCRVQVAVAEQVELLQLWALEPGEAAQRAHAGLQAPARTKTHVHT